MKTKINFPGADQFMKRFFREVDSVVWDMMTGGVGVVTDEGVATLTKTTTDGVDDYRININPLGEQFSMPLPAFAQATPVAGIKEGDIIVRGKSDKISFVVKVNGDGKFRVMNIDGTETSWTAPNMTLLGLDSGVMVLRSLMSMTGGGGFDQMKSMLLPMMMMGGGDSVSEMLPMMLMMQGSVTGPDGAAATNPFGGNMGNMMQTMLMMKMLKGDGGGAGGRSPFDRG